MWTGEVGGGVLEKIILCDIREGRGREHSDLGGDAI